MAESFPIQALALCSETGLKVYAERSLSGRNTKTLLGTAYAVAAAAAGVATYNRAWPVGVFLIAMPAALTLAFSVNNKDARQYETLRFQGNDFEICRIDKYGRQAKPITLSTWRTRFFNEGNAEEGFKLFATGPTTGPGASGEYETHPIAEFLSPGEKEELLTLLKEAQNFLSLPYHLQDEIRANAGHPGPNQS